MKIKHTTNWGATYELNLYKTHYLSQYEGGLAIQATINEDGFEEPWSMITTNLGRQLPENWAVIDTNNNGTNILYELMDAGYCTVMCYAQSGYCSYPVVEFDKKFLDKLEEVR